MTGDSAGGFDVTDKVLPACVLHSFSADHVCPIWQALALPEGGMHLVHSEIL